MDGLGPLAMMFSWQAVLCAVACTGITKIPTSVIDYVMGPDQRRASFWVSSIAYPLIPIVVGMLYAVLVPLRPDVLTEYVAREVEGGWQYVAWAAWGGACGQFAQTIYDRVVQPVTKKRS